MRFREYEKEKEKWITFVESSYYPNFMEQARQKYFPYIQLFDQLLSSAKDSIELYHLILEISGKSRIQLLRIFRRYVSPDTSVEMLKRKSKEEIIVAEFGSRFRLINEVRDRFQVDDDVLVALLREYEDRGQKGYELST